MKEDQQVNPEAEGGAEPPAEPVGPPEETHIQPPEVVAEEGQAPLPAVSHRRTFLVAAAASAGVLVFALAFFMAGFAAHAILDEDDTSAGAAENKMSSAAADDPSWGPDDSVVTIEAYSDFQCPYCKRFAEETLPQLRQTYGDKVHFIFRDLPLTNIHPVAALAAQAGGCAQDQEKFWEYHDLLYANQEALSESTIRQYAEDAGLDVPRFMECLSSNQKMADVLLDMQDAERAGVNSTPSFLINGLLISGAQPYTVFESVIEQALAAQ